MRNLSNKNLQENEETSNHLKQDEKVMFKTECKEDTFGGLNG